MYQRPKSEALFQGDVIGHFKDPVLRSALSKQPEIINIAVKEHRLAILSHSCNIAESSINKRAAFLIAPLQPVPNYITKSSEKYELFKKNKVEPGKSNFINLFRYEPAPEIDNLEWLIDFSKMLAVPFIPKRMPRIETTRSDGRCAKQSTG